ncbi:MAG: GNAT family N-acetyltransferase [Gammaproteobacteria bacterium]|nr:GNAT family N-acetyltransferase [Gammaproteobacteria bacterium]
MAITIRKAKQSDCEQILSFIKGLAEYEKLANEVTANEQLLKDTLFSEKPVAFVLIAELDGKPAGFALYFYNYSTFLAKPGIYLEDLFVDPKYRGKKVGKSLLVKLAQIAVEEDLGRFEWSVLDWNEPAINFYRAMGAIGMDGWTVQRVSGESLKQLAQKET